MYFLSFVDSKSESFAVTSTLIVITEFLTSVDAFVAPPQKSWYESCQAYSTTLAGANPSLVARDQVSG